MFPNMFSGLGLTHECAKVKCSISSQHSLVLQSQSGLHGRPQYTPGNSLSKLVQDSGMCVSTLSIGVCVFVLTPCDDLLSRVYQLKKGSGLIQPCKAW